MARLSARSARAIHEHEAREVYVKVAGTDCRMPALSAQQGEERCCDTQNPVAKLLRPGETCWRFARANRLAEVRRTHPRILGRSCEP